jgi:hypothetical protein
MSENEDLKSQYATLLSRFAALEAEVSNYRSQSRRPAEDPAKLFREEMVRDPHGTMARYGVPADYVTKRLIAKQMIDAGVPLPDELQGLAGLGTQLSATSALENKLEQLSRQVSSIVDSGAKASARQSFQALSANKAKYPNLAKAIAADPDLFNEALSAHGGTAEEFAAAEEARLARVAKVLGAPVTSTAPVTTDVQSKQDAPATAGNLNSEMPPVSAAPQSHDARRAALKAEILKTYGGGDASV